MASELVPVKVIHGVQIYFDPEKNKFKAKFKLLGTSYDEWYEKKTVPELERMIARETKPRVKRTGMIVDYSGIDVVEVIEFVEKAGWRGDGFICISDGRRRTISDVKVYDEKLLKEFKAFFKKREQAEAKFDKEREALMKKLKSLPKE